MLPANFAPNNRLVALQVPPLNSLLSVPNLNGLINTLTELDGKPTDQSAFPLVFPPIPANGLPEVWTIEQWEHYGAQWLDHGEQPPNLGEQEDSAEGPSH